MAKLSLVKGTTSYRAYIFVLDSSVSTGAGKTGLVFNTASLVAYYVRPGAAATSITLATQTVTGAYSSGGFVEIDATNMPGLYRFDVPDAALATGVNAVVVMLKGATNMAPVVMEIELTAVDNQNATSFGLTNLDAAITTRLAPTVAGRTLDVTTTGGAGIDWANVENPTTALNLSATNIDVDQVVASVSGAVGSVTGAVGSVTGAVGSIATGGIVAASFGAGAIDAAAIATDAIGSAELAASAVTEIQSGLSTHSAADVWAVGTRALTDKADFSLSAAGIQAIWDALTSALTTVGSIGKLLVDNITGNAFTRLGAPVGASISADIAAVQADTDNIQTRIPAALVSGRMDSSVGAMAANTLTASALATDAVAEIADQVWDETLADHLGAGSTGAGLNAAGSAGDPWSTALPGAYGAGTAGKIVGDNVNATISSRASQTSLDTVDDFLDTEVAAIKAKTDLIPAAPAAVGDIPTAVQNADALLNRDMATGTDSGSPTVRTVRQALRFLRNKWSISGTTLTVTKEDDATASWTATLTTNASADPVTSSDPA